MELKPTIGIGDIAFGMMRPEISRSIGLPQSSFHEEDEPDQLIQQYDALKLRLTFYGDEGGRMGYIRCAARDLTFGGAEIIGRPVGEVKELFGGNGTMEWEVENYSFFDTHFNERLWLILNVEYGEVTDVEIGVPFKNEQEYDWKR